MNAVDLSVVVPVYNSASTLPELIARLVRTLEPLGSSFELIFVDDCSTDASRALLRDYAARDGRIRVLSLAGNFGGQAALCAGFALVRGRRTVCLDADLENLPEDIPALLAALDEGHDLACGIRTQRRDSWSTRRLPSDLLNAYARGRLKTSVRDLWCGMRAMDSRIVKDIAEEREWCRSLTPLFLSRARSVVEVPIRHAPAKAGSHYSLVRLAAIAVDFTMLTARRPFVVAGLWAAFALAAALVLLLAGLLSHRLWLAMAGLVIGAGAATCGLIAMVGEYVQRLYTLESRPLYRVRADEPGLATSRDDGGERGDDAQGLHESGAMPR